MGPFVLYTDHVTLLQRGNRKVVEHFVQIPEEVVATSIITYEEQLRGRLSVIRRATTGQLVVAYQRLQEMQEFFCAIRFLDFDESAAKIYDELKRQHGVVGTMDLRIAATAISRGGTLVTRNTRDFGPIADLQLQNWSIT